MLEYHLKARRDIHMDKLKRGETAQFFALLRQHIGAEKPDFGNGDSPLSLLYEVYNELNSMDTDQIRADFEALYQAMNGMTLNEMDAVINPVCSLCRHHECAGFIEGVKVGMRIKEELEG